MQVYFGSFRTALEIKGKSDMLVRKTAERSCIILIVLNTLGQNFVLVNYHFSSLLLYFDKGMTGLLVA